MAKSHTLSEESAELFVWALQRERTKTFKNPGYIKTHTQVTQNIQHMNRIDIEMDKIRQQYMEMYDLPKGTGIFFSACGDGEDIAQMIQNFLGVKEFDAL